MESPSFLNISINCALVMCIDASAMRQMARLGNTVFAELIIGGQSLKAGTWRGGPSGKAMRRRQRPSRSARAVLDTMRFTILGDGS